MTLRPRTDADLPVLVSVLRRVHERDGYPVHWPEPAEAWLTPVGTVAAWVAESDGRPAGHLAVRTLDGALVVSRLFVDPDARAHGLSDLLLAAAEGHAAACGAALSLEVHVRAAAAISRYEQRGWVRTGTHTADWHDADGRPARAHRYVAPRYQS